MQRNRSFQHQNHHPNKKQYHHRHQTNHLHNGHVLLYPTLNRGGSGGDRTMLCVQGFTSPRRVISTPFPSIPQTRTLIRSNSTPSPPILPILPPYPTPIPLHRQHTIPPTRMVPPRFLVPPPHPHRVTRSLIPHLRYETIGNPSLKVFRLFLPNEMIQILDEIVSRAERHVSELPDGWQTELYSLTKQDYAMNDIPGMERRIRPMHKFICQAIEILYDCREVVVDQNQPHILKYDSHHTGVELHHDRCDVTANLALSRRDCDYQGGGTYFPDIGHVVRLEQGEFLLHPGSLVHSGIDVSAGERYLMVTFANLK